MLLAPRWLTFSKCAAVAAMLPDIEADDAEKERHYTSFQELMNAAPRRDIPPYCRAFAISPRCQTALCC